MRRVARFARTVSMHGRNENWIQHPDIRRSHSAPELLEGGVFRFIPATPTDAHGTPTVEAELSNALGFSNSEDIVSENLQTPLTNSLEQTLTSSDESNHRGRGEDTTEEGPVCRICMVEFEEGAEDTLTLECDCKGELGLAHKECAIKWFSMKGDRTCEVCKQEIMNLPLMLHSPTYRVWREAPILLIVSTLAYLVFLELFLVYESSGGVAIAISVSFGCILGLLGSMTSTIMVRRRYAWIYATVQFILVGCFASVFHYSKLHLTGILSILLATFAGFGGAMCGTGFIYIYLKWRGSNQHRETTPDIEQPPQPSRAQQQGGASVDHQ